MEPLAEARGLEIRTSDGLIEMDAGDWTGRTLPSLRRTKLWDTVQRNPSRFPFPSGESFVDAEARILDEIERIVHGTRAAVSSSARTATSSGC